MYTYLFFENVLKNELFSSRTAHLGVTNRKMTGRLPGRPAGSVMCTRTHARIDAAAGRGLHSARIESERIVPLALDHADS